MCSLYLLIPYPIVRLKKKVRAEAISDLLPLKYPPQKHTRPPKHFCLSSAHPPHEACFGRRVEGGRRVDRITQNSRTLMNADYQDFILPLKPCSNLLCPSVKLCGHILNLRYQRKSASPINCYLSFNVFARTSDGNASMFGTSSCSMSGRSAMIFGKAICMARPRCFTAVYGLKVGGKVWFNRLNI